MQDHLSSNWASAVPQQRPRTVSVRQPLSCEPCRSRKLKCSRSIPCDTCKRRRCTQNCFYKRNTRLVGGATTSTQQVPISLDLQHGIPGNNEELLNRIRNLEDLVKRISAEKVIISGKVQQATVVPNSDAPGQAEISIQHANNRAFSPPPLGLESPPSSSASVESYGEPRSRLSSFSNSTRADVLPPQLTPSPGSQNSCRKNSGFTGILRGDDFDGVRYELPQSRWTSVLSGSPNTAHILASQRVKPALSNLETHCNHSSPVQPPTLTNFPFDDHQIASFDSLLALLPPRQQLEYLISKYLTLFSPLFHILHDPTFLRQYQQFSNDPSSQPLSWFALLFVVLSLAVTALPENDPLLFDIGRDPSGAKNIRILGSRYRKAAMRCLAADNFMVRHRLSTLQALILLIYAINHSLGEDGGSWPLLGLTQNIALSLGVHVDIEEGEGMNTLEREMRRRCWAGLGMLGTIQATSFGRSEMLGSGRIGRFAREDGGLEVADVNDTDITEHEIQPSEASMPTQMSYMIFKFRLYNLASRICDGIFSRKPGIRMTYEKVCELDWCIETESQKWDRKYLEHGGPNMREVHHQAHWNILKGYSCQLRLLLHRPFFFKDPATEEGPSARSDINPSLRNPEAHISSFQRCIQSSIKLLSIHQVFCETPEFLDYQWFNSGLGSFHAFHGSVVLIAALHRILDPCSGPTEDGKANLLKEMELPPETLREMLHSFQDRLKGLQDRSEICRKSFKVLGGLLATLPSPQKQVVIEETPTLSTVSPQSQYQFSNPAVAYAQGFGQITTSLAAPRQLPREETSVIHNLQPEPWPTVTMDSTSTMALDVLSQSFWEEKLNPTIWLNAGGFRWEEWEPTVFFPTVQVMEEVSV
ncbi:fungal-specific transcription factor domain-containing protein [Pyronema omphalodes]|nr:fungal-specific transcription factor domain-containing protein [Pyronema omphalodes]